MAESIIQISEQRGMQRGKAEGIAEGFEQGARQMSIESTLMILTERFPNAEVNALKPALESIADLNRLKQLNLAASIATSFRAFREQLDA